MNKKFFWLLFLLLPAIGQAQFGNMLKKAKDKVTQRADSRVSKEMDKTLDELEGKNTQKTTASTTTPTAANETPAASQKETVKSFSKFDFVPGERIIYTEDFAQDAIGELPLNWNSTGKGEVVTLDKQPGKWLKLFQNTTYLSGSNKTYDKNFTVEFDLLLPFKYYQHTFPLVQFGLLSSGDLPSTDNRLLKDLNRFLQANVVFRANYNYSTSAELQTFADDRDFFHATTQPVESGPGFYAQPNHVAFQVQKTRLRMWVNNQKVFDIPRALDTTHTFNQLYFQIGSSGYNEEAIGFYVTNLKVATGLPDTRHKLIDEGKFSTTGILFDVNAATIKPESNGVLKEIAGILTEHKNIKIKIVGHTDSDGTDAANLDLSKRRAEAVKAALVKDFNIDGAMMETDGKGESVPAGDNKTKEGKAQNRRVEFIKL
ncbi:MAG TPA: OmpA family protein [Flavisolibacter sp.]|jgi:outer membrane protein OmpA-like peptidoglycan-associated protein|nr:OmpA family protein [Flavisolibacter sp.]